MPRLNSQDIRSLATEFDTTMAMVADLIAELRKDPSTSGTARALAEELATRPDVAHLTQMLLRAYSEITEALGGIRISRETIQAHAIDRIHKSQSKLSEVSTTTESATMELMNGIERALAHIDALDREGPAESAVHRNAVTQLRDEINQLFGHLQFQDITTQQLQGVGSLLGDIEHRVESVAKLFDRSAHLGEEADEASPHRRPTSAQTFNPDATFSNVEERQALADAAFVSRDAAL